MTDKQIIIDYKNLCENYNKEVGCYYTFDGSCNKEQCFTYRLLQLLQAKEQECERLKETLAEIKEIAEECYYECNSMNNCNISCKYYNDCNGEFSYLLAYLNKQISEVNNDNK